MKNQKHTTTKPETLNEGLATLKGKEFALQALENRRKNPPERINNASLPVGAPMIYYCISCGHISDILHECYIGPPPKLCKECQALKDLDWLE